MKGVCHHVFSNRLAPEAALSAEERRGALPHPAQLPEVLLRPVVRDTTQHLVQSGKLLKTLAPVTQRQQVLLSLNLHLLTNYRWFIFTAKQQFYFLFFFTLKYKYLSVNAG